MTTIVRYKCPACKGEKGKLYKDVPITTSFGEYLKDSEGKFLTEDEFIPCNHCNGTGIYEHIPYLDNCQYDIDSKEYHDIQEQVGVSGWNNRFRQLYTESP